MYKNRLITAISYGDQNFSMSCKLNLFTARWIGRADRTIAFARESLPQSFQEHNREILSMKRGGGYWVWKPMVILQALEQCADDDYLMYTDAGIIYSGKISRLIEQMEEDGQSIFLSMGFAPLKHWCKRDAFELMDVSINEYGDLPCISGGWVLLKKNEESIQFIEEWNRYIQNIHILTDIPNICGLPNDPGFHEHRHDQAILTILAKKYNIKPYRSLSYVDCPRAHKGVFEGATDYRESGYGYTTDELLHYMRLSRQYATGERFRQKRLFINTGVRNTDILRFTKTVLFTIKRAIVADCWGRKNDEKLLGK